MVTIGTEAKFKSWTPSQSGKTPDNIISSDHSTKKAFIPSYEKERRPCIELLLSNEYQRIWWREKKSWEKAVVPPTTKKKLLLRMIIKKKPKKDSCPLNLPVLEETKKTNKPKKKENLDLEKKSNAI